MTDIYSRLLVVGVQIHDARKLVGGARNVVVYYHMVVLPHKREFPFGGLHTYFDLLLRFGAATGQPAFQLLTRRRHDEHQNRVRHEVTHLKRTLRIDLEDDRRTPGDLGFHISARRAIAVAMNLGPFEQAVLGHKTVELGIRDEAIVSALDLAGPRSARRDRHGHPHVRCSANEFPDECTFAGTGRARDYVETSSARQLKEARAVAW